jgi:NAD(P)-dependent dehydrogenase (short-subunit alcohol dehydrogenase family)
MSKLNDKVAVITGGSSGIGLATAKLFAEEGAHVFITGRRQEELDRAAAAIGSGVTAIQADVAKVTEVERLYAQVGREFGRVDIVVANAGIVEIATLDNFTDQHFDNVFNVNVRGAVNTVKGALPLLRPGGAVILVSSVLSSEARDGFGVYSASKAAVRALGRTWARELNGRGVRVNTISPGPIETAMVDLLAPTTELRERRAAKMKEIIPMGRSGTPAEIAAAALFLASEDSSYITAGDLAVDGGFRDLHTVA